jgi:hypothetical protein
MRTIYFLHCPEFQAHATTGIQSNLHGRDRGSNRSKFKTPEEDYKDKKICVTGKITAYDSLPEIIADDPKQIRIE